jgi:hypothetical protein
MVRGFRCEPLRRAHASPSHAMSVEDVNAIDPPAGREPKYRQNPAHVRLTTAAGRRAVVLVTGRSTSP